MRNYDLGGHVSPSKDALALQVRRQRIIVRSRIVAFQSFHTVDDHDDRDAGGQSSEPAAGAGGYWSGGYGSESRSDFVPASVGENAGSYSARLDKLALPYPTC